MSNYQVIHDPTTPAKPIKAWVNGVPFADNAREQLQRIAQLPFIHKWVAAMPDVHLGKGATVGSVIATKGAVIPAAVGVDIGCVDFETEYLTPSGWKRISDYTPGDSVLVYDLATGIGRFEEPLAYIRKPSAGFFHIKTKYGVNQALSPDHRVLTFLSGRRRAYEKPAVISAEALARNHADRVLGFGNRFLTTPEKVLVGTRLPFTDAELRVIVMTAADGSFPSKNRAVLHVKKRRKFERAQNLLAAAGCRVISEKEKTYPSKGTYYSFRYIPVTREKSLAQLWGASEDQLRVIADELVQWDGNQEDSVFFTRRREEADFAQWAFLAAGYRAVSRADADSDGKLDYRVFAHTNTKVGVKGSPKTRIYFAPSHDGMEYCFTVSTGFFLIRRGGVTAVTGNCGVSALQLDIRAEDLPEDLGKLRAALEEVVPHGSGPAGKGIGDWKDAPEYVMKEWRRPGLDPSYLLEKYPALFRGKEINQLGTLGGGNHFLEICLDEQGWAWILLHSGSRGIGNRIGTHFIDLAKKDMNRWFINLPDQDLAYLPQGSEHYADYMHAVHWAQNYAKANRRLMAKAALSALAQETRPLAPIQTAVSCHHNYVSEERHYGDKVLVTRKGAVSAKEGELGIIPGSMGAKSYIVRGKGNPESFHSCSHGAGRTMSRGEAVRRVSMEEHLKAVAHVECRKDEAVIDETPSAYKNIDAVMAAQSDLVEVVHTLRQVLCIKG